LEREGFSASPAAAAADDDDAGTAAGGTELNVMAGVADTIGITVANTGGSLAPPVNIDQDHDHDQG